VGLGGGHLPAAGSVALRRGGAGAGAQGRLRPRGAPPLPLKARRREHVHDAYRAQGHDRRDRRRGALPAEAVARHLLGGRAPQPRGHPLVPRAVRRHRPGLLRPDRELSLVRELPHGRGARGLDGPARAGMGREGARRGGAAAAARGAR
jgi:hypothetical protein